MRLAGKPGQLLRRTEHATLLAERLVLAGQRRDRRDLVDFVCQPIAGACAFALIEAAGAKLVAYRPQPGDEPAELLAHAAELRVTIEHRQLLRRAQQRQVACLAMEVDEQLAERGEHRLRRGPTADTGDAAS